MKHLFTPLFVLLFFPTCFAQRVVMADDIIDKINRGESVSYENVTISGDLDLTALDNRERTNVQKNWFSNDSERFESTVSVALRFENCIFEGDVLAYYHEDGEDDTFIAHFTEDVIFRNCVMKEASEFKYSEFGEAVDFYGTRFSEEANFKYAEFDEGPVFERAYFEDDANFKYAEFPEHTTFAGAVFDDVANFKYSEFPDGVSFAKARFNDLANFKYTKFSSPLDMKDVAFEGSEDFKYTEVDGRSFTAYLIKNQ